MTLSPELRDLVYDLALIVDERSVRVIQPLIHSYGYLDKRMMDPSLPNAICAFKRTRKRHKTHGTDCRSLQCDYTRPVATQPALTRVTRQVRAETLPIFYGKNTFVIIPNLYFLGLQETLWSIKKGFLSSIGNHNAGLIKQLKLWLVGDPDDVPSNEDLLAALEPKFCGLRVEAVEIVRDTFQA